MIENKKQFDITVGMLKRFETVRAQLEGPNELVAPGVEPVLVQAMRESQDEMIKEMQTDIDRFEKKLDV